MEIRHPVCSTQETPGRFRNCGLKSAAQSEEFGLSGSRQVFATGPALRSAAGVQSPAFRAGEIHGAGKEVCHNASGRQNGDRDTDLDESGIHAFASAKQVQS